MGAGESPAAVNPIAPQQDSLTEKPWGARFTGHAPVVDTVPNGGKRRSNALTVVNWYARLIKAGFGSRLGPEMIEREPSMAVEKRSLFSDSTPTPRAGDGGPGYSAIAPSDRLDTTGGLDSAISRSRGHEDQYRLAQHQSSGVKPGGSSGFGLQGDVKSGFWTNGSVPADSNDQPETTTGGTDRLVTNDTLPTDSNLTAGGRPVA